MLLLYWRTCHTCGGIYTSVFQRTRNRVCLGALLIFPSALGRATDTREKRVKVNCKNNFAKGIKQQQQKQYNKSVDTQYRLHIRRKIWVCVKYSIGFLMFSENEAQEYKLNTPIRSLSTSISPLYDKVCCTWLKVICQRTCYRNKVKTKKPGDKIWSCFSNSIIYSNTRHTDEHKTQGKYW